MENNIKGIDTTIGVFEESIREKGAIVLRGDGKEVHFRSDGIKIVQDSGVTWETSQATEAIQETYSLNPNMLRHTREAEDVPEEVRKEYIEAIGAELNKEGLE